MRKLIVSNLMSLDGFFEGPNGELDWHVVDEEFFDYAREMLRSADSILFGRKTYEMMARYWPAAPKDEIAEKMNTLAKIVFSRTLDKAEWQNSRLVRDDAAQEVATLKKMPGKDMVILGSAKLSLSLLEQGLIDEYRVILNPVLLGKGNLLFQNAAKKLNLKLKNTRMLKSGVALLYYGNA